jgi:hypothetical protein
MHSLKSIFGAPGNESFPVGKVLKRRTANARARFAINNIVGRVCIQVIAGLFVRGYPMIVGEQIGEIAGNAEMLIRLIVKLDLGPSIEPEPGHRLAR